jgi:peptide/nickel transport system substrate-binding protein
LLNEAGYTSGLDISADYTLAYGDVYGEMMEMIKAYWLKIGVNLQLKVSDYATFSSIKYAKTYDYIIAGNMTASHPLLIWPIFFYTQTVYNRAAISDPHVDEVLDKVMVTVDDTERTKMLKDLNIYLLEECNVIPPPTMYMYFAWQPWLKGYHGEFSAGGTYGHGQMFAHAWVDQNVKSQYGK